jgi:hypothetical protein
MSNINNASQLKEAILQLENKQANQKQLLIEQFELTVESLKPMNIIKNTLSDAINSPNILSNILYTALGLTSGYLSKKLFVGRSGNPLRRVFGFILQYGMANLVSKPPDILKSSISRFLQLARSKRENNLRD